MPEMPEQDIPKDARFAALEEERVEITDLPPEEQVKRLATTFTYMPHPRWRLRVTPRQFTIAMRIGMLVSLLLLLVLVTPDSGRWLALITKNVVQTFVAQPTPLLPPGSDDFYLDAAIPGMTVLLDEHRIALPRIGLDAPLHLSPGLHIFFWSVPPFNAQTCTVSRPFARGDTCRFALEQTTYQKTPYQIILLQESLATLSQQQRTLLTGALEQALEKLSTTEDLAKGELFTGSNGPAVASQPLQATLNIHFHTQQDAQTCQTFVVMLAQNGIPCDVEGQSCEQLCTTPWQARQAYAALLTPFSWLAFATTDAQWDYRTLDGNIIGLNQPLGAEGSLLDRQIVLLRINWYAAWQVDVLLGSQLQTPIYVNWHPERTQAGTSAPTVKTMLVGDDPACSAALGYVTAGLTRVPITSSVSRLAHVYLISTSNPALGCLIVAMSGGANVNGVTGHVIGDTAYYIVRFGILETANDVAYLQAPELPHADARALQIVAMLKQTAGQDITILVGN